MAFLDLEPRQILRSTPVMLEMRLVAWRKRRAMTMADLRYAAWFTVAYDRTRKLPPLREAAARSMREVERYRAREAQAERRYRAKLEELRAAARAAKPTRTEGV